MITTVIKRNGQKVSFDIFKIERAVRKALLASDGVADEQFVSDITSKAIDGLEDEASVEEIQDRVEIALMESERKDVAKKYITYRDKRATIRQAKTRDVFLEIIEAKNNEVTRENANMNAESPSGMMMKFASESTKPFVDDYLLSDIVKYALEDNYIHIHDKDYYPTKSLTCVQQPLDKILKGGFHACHAEVRPAKRIETAATLASIALETSQNEMHGGQAIPAFDFFMAPYVRDTFKEEISKLEKALGRNLEHLYNTELVDYLVVEDLTGLSEDMRLLQHAINMTVKRVHQAMEAFIHNMNTIHSRGGNQVVFSSINYGTDTSAEGRCVIRELLKSTFEGVGNGSTAIFPIQIWKKKRGVNYFSTDPNYDLYKFACKVAAKRFFPNFLNLDASFNVHSGWTSNDPNRYMYEVATMGCRTRVFENRFGDKTSVGRGNLSFTSVNIVRIAIECMNEKNQNKKINLFFEKLGNILDVVALQLHERYQFQATALAKQFPLLMSELWMGCEALTPNATIDEVMIHGTLGIGFIGLAECLIALTGKHHAESKDSQELGLKIIKFFKEKTTNYCYEYNHNFSVIATPAEGLAGRFTKRDKADFGIIPGVTDKDYYTNSNHVPVYYKCSPKHKAEIEAPYHKLTLGGHIFYVELDGDATHNDDAIMQIVDLIDKYDMGYGSVNHNRNHCPMCGYEDAEKPNNNEKLKCPNCGTTMETIQRITGYLVGTTERWNSGKLAELKDRVCHK